MDGQKQDELSALAGKDTHRLRRAYGGLKVTHAAEQGRLKRPSSVHLVNLHSYGLSVQKRGALPQRGTLSLSVTKYD